MTFPNREAGFLADENGAPAAPSFGRKKDAKQYAAKCCVEWLMKGGYMPADGVNVEFPKSKSKKARAQPVDPSVPAQAPPAKPATAKATTATPAAAAAVATTSTAQQQDETPAQRVTALCRLRTSNTSPFIPRPHPANPLEF